MPFYLKDRDIPSDIATVHSALIVPCRFCPAASLAVRVVCVWTSGRREELARQAAEYDAVIVLGCDAAVEVVRSSLESTHCRIIQAMEVEGVMNVIPSLHFPFKISLEVSGVSRVLQTRS
jgi:hypothetical protein